MTNILQHFKSYWEKFLYLCPIYPDIVPKGLIDNKSALGGVMNPVPVPELMMTQLTVTHKHRQIVVSTLMSFFQTHWIVESD